MSTHGLTEKTLLWALKVRSWDKCCRDVLGARLAARDPKETFCGCHHTLVPEQAFAGDSTMDGLTTSRLRVRKILPADATAFLHVLGNGEVMAYSNDGPLDEFRVEAWVSDKVVQYSTNYLTGHWAITLGESASVIGYVSLNTAAGRTGDGELEFGIRLRRRDWGKGLASEATQLALEYAFGIHNAKRIIAIVDPNNTSSVALLRKFGMTFQRRFMADGYDYPDHVYTLERS